MFLLESCLVEGVGDFDETFQSESWDSLYFMRSFFYRRMYSYRRRTGFEVKAGKESQEVLV